MSPNRPVLVSQYYFVIPSGGPYIVAGCRLLFPPITQFSSCLRVRTLGGCHPNPLEQAPVPELYWEVHYRMSWTRTWFTGVLPDMSQEIFFSSAPSHLVYAPSCHMPVLSSSTPAWTSSRTNWHLSLPWVLLKWCCAMALNPARIVAIMPIVMPCVSAGTRPTTDFPGLSSSCLSTSANTTLESLEIW